jgi:hypothetical protein
MERGLYAPPYDGGVESPLPLEGPTARIFRRVGLLLFLLASLLPYHGCHAHPGEFSGTGVPGSLYSRECSGINGEAFAEQFVRTRLLGDSRFQLPDALVPCDGQTEDFIGPGVFLALPFWLAALILVRGKRPRTRWVVGLLLWAALGALCVAAAADGLDIYVGEGGKGNQTVSWSWPYPKTVWAPIVGVLLLIRPRHRWESGDVEATVSSQAVLGWGICVASPCMTAWGWATKEGQPLSAIAHALWINYRSGFWLALVALALIAAPLFASEDSLRRLYDRCRPWRKRLSNPDPATP